VTGPELDLVRFVAEHRWEPLSTLMEAVSAWWFKSILLIGIGLVADLRLPRRLPIATAGATVAYTAAHLLSQWGKDLTDRDRPSIADPSILVAGDLPGSSAMPSSHAATAFAAAVVIALVHPRLRWWVLGLAAPVGVSRVYLGVHYPSDVLVGAALGAIVGWATWWGCSKGPGLAGRTSPPAPAPRSEPGSR